MSVIRRLFSQDRDLVFGNRNRYLIRARKTASDGFLVANKLFRWTKRPDLTHGPIIVWPVIDDDESLGDIVARIRWAIPTLPPGRAIELFVSSGVQCANVDDVPIPGYLQTISSHSPPMVLRREHPSRNDIRASSLVLVHDAPDLLHPWVAPRLDRVALVDPTFFSLRETRSWRDLVPATADHCLLKELRLESRENLRDLLARCTDARVVNVFGTGPALKEVYQHDLSRDFNIVCNSTVASPKLLERLKPRVITCADPVFHFGPSRYAAQFREDLVAAAEEWDAHVVVPSRGCHYWLAVHYPELRKRLVGLHNARHMTIPTVDQPTVLGTANILTWFMLPVAMAMRPEVIQIWGCDGRKPDEKYFWKHSKEAQYTGLMETVFKAHPSFFRDRDYADYYAEHVRTLTRMVSHAEREGIEVRSCSTSYIPALAERAALPNHSE